MNTQNHSRPTVYQQRAIQSRKRNARIDARLTAEFAARAVALQAKLGTICAANEAKRNEEWKESIMDEIDMIPENPADIFTPEEVARFDLDEGRDSQATEHYSKLSDIEAYEYAYDIAKRETEATEDYESDILDREDWSRGGW